MLQLRKMFRGLLLVIFLAKIYAEELSYFEQRKQMLAAEKAVVYPRNKHSNIPPFFYVRQQNRPTNFPTIINENDLCSRHEKVFLFVSVRSIYSHLDRREILRDLFRSYSLQDLPMRTVYGFFFARSKDENENKLIQEESLKHGDIIQEGFIDSYTNLTLKTLNIFKWTVEYCPNTEYVMIANDELVFDLRKISTYLMKDYLGTTLNDHYAICLRQTNRNVIHHTFPWYKDVPKDIQYRAKKYPNHCHGIGYVAHITVINKLYKASNTTTYFMPDDVWTAVIAEKLRLRLDDHPQFYSIEANIEHLFSDKSYMLNPLMIALTDYGPLKGKEVKTMANLLNSLKNHYKNYQEFQKNMMVKSVQCSKDIPSISSFKPLDPRLFLLYIPVFIVLFIMYKLFRKWYSCCCPKFFR